jgi:hypothetical protein
MTHETHKQHKKLKKLAQLFKNRHTQHINQQAEVHERNRELDREREEEMRAASLASSRKAEGKPGNTVWSAKMQEIRDKNTGRHRMATERWNRFAGTEGGGGRGL